MRQPYSQISNAFDKNPKGDSQIKSNKFFQGCVEFENMDSEWLIFLFCMSAKSTFQQVFWFSLCSSNA